MNGRIKAFLFGGPGTATALGDVGLAIFRIGTGLLLALGHGMGKVWGDDGWGPPDRFIGGVEDMGFPAPTAFAWMAALTEFVGGLLIAAGLLTRPMALLILINMCVAAFIRHAGDPWYGASPSKEMALLYLLPSILLLLVGGGRYAVDRFLRKGAKKSTRPAGEK